LSPLPSFALTVLPITLVSQLLLPTSAPAEDGAVAGDAGFIAHVSRRAMANEIVRRIRAKLELPPAGDPDEAAPLEDVARASSRGY
jgi:hypothetical protein